MDYWIEVIPGSAAFVAGMRTGDEIIKVSDIRTVEFDQLRHEVHTRTSGASLPVEVMRGAELKELTVIPRQSNHCRRSTNQTGYHRPAVSRPARK